MLWSPLDWTSIDSLCCRSSRQFLSDCRSQALSFTPEIVSNSLSGLVSGQETFFHDLRWSMRIHADQGRQDSPWWKFPHPWSRSRRQHQGSQAPLSMWLILPHSPAKCQHCMGSPLHWWLTPAWPADNPIAFPCYVHASLSSLVFDRGNRYLLNHKKRSYVQTQSTICVWKEPFGNDCMTGMQAIGAPIERTQTRLIASKKFYNRRFFTHPLMRISFTALAVHAPNHQQTGSIDLLLWEPQFK